MEIKQLSLCNQTAGPIGTKFGTRMWIDMGIDAGLTKLACRYPRGAILGVSGCKNINTGKCHDLKIQKLIRYNFWGCRGKKQVLE